jgi:hypothetical protein
MSLGGPDRPDHLSWERDYSKYFLTRFIGLLLHGYDTWYWYHGIWLMKRTPGTDAFGLMLYFGQINIFDWISYVMRVLVVLMLGFLVRGCIEALYQQWWEKKLDHEVPPARLKYLADRWAIDWDPNSAFASMTGAARVRRLLSPPLIVRHASSASVRSAPIPRWDDEKDVYGWTRETTVKELDWRQSLPETKSEYGSDGKSAMNSPITTTTSEPEPKSVRSMTDKLRKTLLGWQPEHNLIGGERMYRYTPSLEGVSTALTMLESLNEKKSLKCAVLRYHINLLVRFVRIIPILITHQVRPRVLFAIRMHIRTLSYTCRSHQLDMLRHALLHPSYAVVSAEDVILASRIIVTLHPRRKPNNWEYFAVAWGTLSTCTILVIGTELAIQWNYIRGVQDISSVGQLIPMAIGVCGLIKTLWTATLDRKHGEKWCFGACRGSKKRLDWADASESFEKARAAWETRREPAAVKAGLEKEKDLEV